MESFLGYGFSDKPQYYNYSIFDMADMVERLVLHLKIESVVLVAHDVGDSVAQEILRRDNLKNNHYKVEKCILMNGGIMTDIYQPVLAQYVMRNEYFGQILFSKFFFRYFAFKNRFSRLFGEFKQPSEMEMYDMYLAIKYKDGNERLHQTIGRFNVFHFCCCCCLWNDLILFYIEKGICKSERSTEASGTMP